MAMALRVSSTASALRRAHAAAAAIAPQIAVGWNPRSCKWPARFPVTAPRPRNPLRSCDRLVAANAQRPALGQDGRREHGTGMPIHAHIVVVECVGSYPVDEGSIGCCQIATGGNFRSALVLRRGSDRSSDKLHGRLASAGNHDADAVDHADACAIATSLW